MGLLFLAFKNTLRKFHWLLVAIIVPQLVFFAWQVGFSGYADFFRMVLVFGLVSVLGVLLVAIPIECNRLKKRMSGLHWPE